MFPFFLKAFAEIAPLPVMRRVPISSSVQVRPSPQVPEDASAVTSSSSPERKPAPSSSFASRLFSPSSSHSSVSKLSISQRNGSSSTGKDSMEEKKASSWAASTGKSSSASTKRSSSASSDTISSEAKSSEKTTSSAEGISQALAALTPIHSTNIQLSIRKTLRFPLSISHLLNNNGTDGHMIKHCTAGIMNCQQK